MKELTPLTPQAQAAVELRDMLFGAPEVSGDDNLPEIVGTATFIQVLPDGHKGRKWRGDVRLYRLNPPMVTTHWLDQEQTEYQYVAVSAAGASGHLPETYIFGASEDGTVPVLDDLPGSYQGGHDHAKALRYAGYEILDPANDPNILRVSETKTPLKKKEI